ncbi:hypothetical protein BJY01DRAFT_252039 [Aspergillus pseudoustus]|uniref:Uncharacterized protein n=1 Tax=Aspergillus pseudoustus TaxID=1810923 RepID=A0ABR4JBB9_9EURO
MLCWARSPFSAQKKHLHSQYICVEVKYIVRGESTRSCKTQARWDSAVAAAMLEGEIEYRAANYDQAFKSLRHTIDLEDKLPYSEPWSWMQPVRHAYAALKMEQGQLEEAAQVYRADLGMDNSIVRPRRHPNNVWSL